MKSTKSIKRKAPRPLIIILKGFIRDLNKDIAGLEMLARRHTLTYNYYVKGQDKSLKFKEYEDAKSYASLIKNSKRRVEAIESPIASLKMVVRGYEADLRILREAHNFLDRNNVNEQIRSGNIKNITRTLDYVRNITDLETKYKEFL